MSVSDDLPHVSSDNHEINHGASRASSTVDDRLRLVLAESPFSFASEEGENGFVNMIAPDTGGAGDINEVLNDEDGGPSLLPYENDIIHDTDPETQMWFEVRVTDTGIGLTQEQQSRLFQSFSQADSSTTRKFGGTGLGLAISKGLVEVMGGKIWVESEFGKGSTFAFCVPLRAPVNLAKYLPESRPPSPPRAKPFRLKEKSLQVLVAEDNLVNQLLISKMLKHYGHEVRSSCSSNTIVSVMCIALPALVLFPNITCIQEEQFSTRPNIIRYLSIDQVDSTCSDYDLVQVQLVGNGQLAVEAVQTGKLDMILMDLQMPVLDGLSATKAIRALGGRGQDVPIYALTADVLTKSHGSLDAMGLDGYLTKPINWQSLSQVIENVVNGRRRSP